MLPLPQKHKPTISEKVTRQEEIKFSVDDCFCCCCCCVGNGWRYQSSYSSDILHRIIRCSDPCVNCVVCQICLSLTIWIAVIYYFGGEYNVVYTWHSIFYDVYNEMCHTLYPFCSHAMCTPLEQTISAFARQKSALTTQFPHKCSSK